MWNEETKGGVKYIERYIDPLTGKRKRASVTMEGKYSKRQEKTAREALDRKIKQLTSVSPDTYTLGQVAEYYYKDQERTVTKQTAIRNQFAIKANLDMLGKDVLIDRLTAGYVRERYGASGKENGTLNEHLIRLKAFIRWAYRNDYIKDIAWLDKLTPYDNERKKEELADKFLEPEELRTLLEGMQVKKWRDLTEFMALSGMRVGEAIGLLNKDVDFENRNIHVCGTYSSIIRERENTTKTRRDREVYMQQELYDLCRRLDLQRKKRELVSGVRSDYFFSGVSGEPLEYYAYNKYLKENAAALLERDFKTTTHIMRHTHVALMAENGVSLDAISRRLGHANSKITREIYFHVTRRMKERDNAEFEHVKIL